MDQLEKQKQDVLTIRKCQRNWDKEKVFPKSHVEHLLYLATNSPSKQDEIRFGLCVVTNEEIRNKIYDDYVWGYHRHGNDAGRNTQMGAHVLFIYARIRPSDFNRDTIGIDVTDDENLVSEGFEYRSDINFDRDIGLSMGIVSFAAAQLGYKTGFNTNLYYNKYTSEDWRELLGIEDESWEPEVVLGIGFPDESLEWYQSRDIEYLEADPREKNIDYENTLNDYKGIRKKCTDITIREFGPQSHDFYTNKSRPKGIPFKWIY
jgi:hypothetical protein